MGTPLISSGVLVEVGLVEEQEAISSEFRRGDIHVGDPFYSRVTFLQPWPLKWKSSEGGD